LEEGSLGRLCAWAIVHWQLWLPWCGEVETRSTN
jgi:hypothetical protein